MQIKISKRWLIIVTVLAALIAVAGYGTWNAIRPNVVAVTLADGSTLIGDLHGHMLCHYLRLFVAKDKAGKPTIQAQPGGAVYGGVGCVEISAPILMTEALTPGTQYYGLVTSR